MTFSSLGDIYTCGSVDSNHQVAGLAAGSHIGMGMRWFFGVDSNFSILMLYIYGNVDNISYSYYIGFRKDLVFFVNFYNI